MLICKISSFCVRNESYRVQIYGITFLLTGFLKGLGGWVKGVFGAFE